MPHVNVRPDALPANTPVRLEHQGAGIVLVRWGGGVAAFPDVCPHAGWRLSDGECADGLLECPGHGWEFRVSTGECVTVPTYCLTPLRVVPDGDVVRVEWEPPACVDEKGGGAR
jgi:nitrite reductase/ring-hydroxylating ferredoxin subunit